jgi:hypothetical protein
MIVLLAFALWLVATDCYAGPVFPDLPKNSSSTILALPTQGEIILDVRSTVLSGDPITPAAGNAEGYIDTVGIQVGVFDLAKQTESIWDLPHDIPLVVPITCNSCTMRASWASKRSQLLLAMKDSAYLVDGAGGHEKLELKMPGISVRYVEAHEFAISDDGLFVAFGLSTRDPGDKSPDANDPYTAKFGKFYSGVMYEDRQGSKPITIAMSGVRFDANGKLVSGKEESLPAWNPDGKRVAYLVRDDGSGALAIGIAEIGDKGIVPIAAVSLPAALHHPSIEELRWSPDGKKLGFIVADAWNENSNERSASKLFTVNADGQGLSAMQFSKGDINVNAFAWSPAGDKFALRSDLEAKTICNHNLSFFLQTGAWPCRISQHLFTSNVNGSGLKRVSKQPEFRRGQLFWIR